MDIFNKENNHCSSNGANEYDPLGRRGGTMSHKPYSGGTAGQRSDSNPTKHRVSKFEYNAIQNNRYSENCDDLLMLDMSEAEGDESVLIK